MTRASDAVHLCIARAAATRTMAIVVRVKPGDHKLVSNEATVASDVLDPDLSNNIASATTAIRSPISRS